MSRLLQIPFLAQMFEHGHPIGCITGTRQKLGNHVLELAGVRSEINAVTRGMEDLPHFKEAVLDECVVTSSRPDRGGDRSRARELQEHHPDRAAILLECSMLPPYAKAARTRPACRGSTSSP